MGHAELHRDTPPRVASPTPQSQLGTSALDRRSASNTAASSPSSDGGVCSQCCRSRDQSRSQIYRASPYTSPRPLKRSQSDKGELVHDGLHTPPPFTSPSAASSMGFSNPASSISPLRRELSHTTLPDGIDAMTSRAARHDLARRLSQLARRLTYDGAENLDEMMVGSQLEQLEKVVGSGRYNEPKGHYSNDTGFEGPARSDMGSALGSPVSCLFKSRFSDLSASLHREREAEAEKDREEEPPPSKKGMNGSQAKKIIDEMTKLNEELSTVVNNLKARQEESEHIQGLLIERAERAAQRIIFLQNRISYLEQELRENDDEMQHLRICLKAVEIQLPPHPDKELQRCISNFKDDYQALKRRRAHRASMASVMGHDVPIFGTPTR